jgi:hypothetical protein
LFSDAGEKANPAETGETSGVPRVFGIGLALD